MTLARWPDHGYLPITEVPDGELGGRLRFAIRAPDGLEMEPDLWSFGYWHIDFAGQHQPIRFDRQTNTVTFVGPQRPTYGIRSRDRGFYFENALAALDRPGEWWLDRDSSLLWFWPPDRIDDDDAELAVTPTLLRLDRVQHLEIAGLTFSATRGDAIVMEDVEDVVLSECTVRAVGGVAVTVSGAKSGVRRCLIEDVGDSAVSLTGGDRWTLRPGRLFVQDSEIRRYGQWVRTYTAAVELHGVGHDVVDNRFHDAPHMGVYIQGNDHRIEGNLFYDLLRDTDDAGAVYQFLDWTARGNLVRNNTFCRLRSIGTKAMAVYLDAFSSGAYVVDNVVVDVPYGIVLNGGSDNFIQDNLIIGGSWPLWIRASVPWMRSRYLSVQGAPLRRQLESVPAAGSDYAQRYPGLRSVLGGDNAEAERNVITGNRIVAPSFGLLDAQVRRHGIVQGNHLLTSLAPSELDRIPAVCASGP